MKPMPPKFTEPELQLILESELVLPDKLDEEDYTTEIRGNKKIKWRINHFLFTRKLLALLLEKSTIRQWTFFKSLNWVIAFCIAGYAISTGQYKIFFFLLLYPFLVLGFDHWIFLFNMSVAIAIKYLFKIDIEHFWIFFLVVLIGYVLNKAIEERIETKILNNAFSDWPTFWRYYSNKFIYMDDTALNDEYKRLTSKFPELIN